MTFLCLFAIMVNYYKDNALLNKCLFFSNGLKKLGLGINEVFELFEKLCAVSATIGGGEND